MSSGKGWRKAGIRKLCKNIKITHKDQRCFSLPSVLGVFLRIENIPHCLSLYSKDTLSPGVSLERKVCAVASLNLYLFVVRKLRPERDSSVPMVLKPTHSTSTGGPIFEIISGFWLCGLKKTNHQISMLTVIFVHLFERYTVVVKSTVNIFMNSVENMMLKVFGNHFIKPGVF